MADEPLTATPEAPAPAPTPTPTSTPDSLTTPPPPAPVVDVRDAHKAWLAAPEAPAQARNPDGTFAAAPPTPDAPPAPAAAPAAEPTPAAASEPAVKYIEGKLGEEPLRLRADALIPVLRHGETRYLTLEQVQREGMLKVDYDEGRKGIKERERQLHADELRLKARAEAFEADEARLQAALTDAGAFDEYQQHLQLMQSNPTYKATWDAAREGRLLKADQQAEQAAAVEQRVAEMREQADQWIQEAVGRHPGVSVERVRERYGTALINRQLTRMDPADVEAIAAAEAQSVEAVTAPMAESLKALNDRLARLEQENAALKQNQQTTHALARGHTVSTAPLAGAPPAPTAPSLVPGNGARDMDTLTRQWVRGPAR